MIALPSLESIGFRRFASAAQPTAFIPKRAVFMGIGSESPANLVPEPR